MDSQSGLGLRARVWVWLRIRVRNRLRVGGTCERQPSQAVGFFFSEALLGHQCEDNEIADRPKEVDRHVDADHRVRDLIQLRKEHSGDCVGILA